MAQVELNKRVFSKNQYQKVIDTSFTQLVPLNQIDTVPTSSVSVDQFFEYYNQLFFDIPKFGEVNSHEYLIQTSQEYIGTSNIVNGEIQALIDEITELRQENLDLQQQLLTIVQNTNNG